MYGVIQEPASVAHLREQRAKHWSAMKVLVDKADAEHRSLTAAEASTFDEHDGQVNQLDRAIKEGY
jgi:hypothetical protein